MLISIPKSIYPKVAIMKAAYQFTDYAYIYIQQDEENYIINITAKDKEKGILEEEFKNELLAQAVRHEIYLQTKDVRQLITMRALASTIVGEQKEIIQSKTFDEDAILKDWFEHEDNEV